MPLVSLADSVLIRISFSWGHDSIDHTLSMDALPIEWSSQLLIWCTLRRCRVVHVTKQTTRHDIIVMGWCKKYVTQLLTHWSYIFLTLTHRVMLFLSLIWDIVGPCVRVITHSKTFVRISFSTWVATLFTRWQVLLSTYSCMRNKEMMAIRALSRRSYLSALNFCVSVSPKIWIKYWGLCGVHFVCFLISNH